jgi:hypothetical protein
MTSGTELIAGINGFIGHFWSASPKNITKPTRSYKTDAEQEMVLFLRLSKSLRPNNTLPTARTTKSPWPIRGAGTAAAEKLGP